MVTEINNMLVFEILFHIVSRDTQNRDALQVLPWRLKLKDWSYVQWFVPNTTAIASRLRISKSFLTEDKATLLIQKKKTVHASQTLLAPNYPPSTYLSISSNISLRFIRCNSLLPKTSSTQAHHAANTSIIALLICVSKARAVLLCPNDHSSQTVD